MLFYAQYVLKKKAWPHNLGAKIIRLKLPRPKAIPSKYKNIRNLLG